MPGEEGRCYPQTASATTNAAGDPFAAWVAELTPSQRDKAIREFYAPAYRDQIRRLASYGLLSDEEEDV
jgi:hypothetical protein